MDAFSNLALAPLFLVLAALVADALLGEPTKLWRRFGHPVAWMAALLMWGEDRFNKPDWNHNRRRTLGFLWMLATLAIVVAIAISVQQLSLRVFPPWLAAATLVALMAILLAYRSLLDHVRAVKDALDTNDLEKSRTAVGRIVGRDTRALDKTGVARAAIESLAENFSDGLVAPAFWALIGGFPGLVAYKFINTADSMIGHCSPRFEAFGWAAARMDDAANFLPARLTVLLIVLGALAVPRAHSLKALKATRRDGKRHASPNAGPVEAAMAGALGVRLGGPRAYANGKTKDSAWLGDFDDAGDASPDDLERAISVVHCAWGMGLMILAMAGVAGLMI